MPAISHRSTVRTSTRQSCATSPFVRSFSLPPPSFGIAPPGLGSRQILGRGWVQAKYDLGPTVLTTPASPVDDPAESRPAGRGRMPLHPIADFARRYHDEIAPDRRRR